MPDGLALVVAFAGGVALKAAHELVGEYIRARSARAHLVRERRDDLYLRLTEFLISMPTRLWEAVVRDDQAGFQREFREEWDRLRAELFVFGSRRTQRAVEKVRRQVDAYAARSAELRAEEDAKDREERIGADQMVRKAFEETLGPPITSAVTAIRRDLRLGWRSPAIRQVT